MKIVLLDNIKNLGSIGSTVEVTPGYARNYLIPRAKAVLATKKNIEILKKQQYVLQSKIDEKKIQAESSAKAINDIGNVTIMLKSSIEGKLFGSVRSKDIAEKITKSVGFKIFKSQIRLPNYSNTIRKIGVYNIKIHIYKSIFSNITVTISKQLENKK